MDFWVVMSDGTLIPMSRIHAVERGLDGSIWIDVEIREISVTNVNTNKYPKVIPPPTLRTTKSLHTETRQKASVNTAYIMAAFVMEE